MPAMFPFICMLLTVTLNIIEVSCCNRIFEYRQIRSWEKFISLKIYSRLFCIYVYIYILCIHSLFMQIEHFCHGKNVWNALCFTKKLLLQFINLFLLLETESLSSYMLQKFIIQTKAESPWKGTFQTFAIKASLLKGKKKRKKKK